ncbi:protein adenylyltransferase SelO [Hyphococcus sp.]|uniref:protein adenylyltransferase SelO n=1 Tax=Hyphococcus sp. TaxID=2038636 RepID=UPI0035C67537
MENYKPDPVFEKLGLDNGAPFYDPVTAAAFPDHTVRYRNQRWAEKVGLGDLSEEGWVSHFGRFEPLPDNLQAPVAIRYHGHQFRSYNPDIGDGRGFLFAQLRDEQNRLLDLGTKGSGKTPYSRFGDGRLTLKGGVREVLATEMLEAQGVYTSKTFSLIETGEKLYREDEPSPARSAVLVRLSHSHVRFGAFQRLAYEKNDEAIAALVDYCIEQFYPALAGKEGEDRILSLFEKAVQHTAQLAAQWMAAGFVHGVLNTDNMNVTGESFDYGPWRFAPIADPSFTAAYFDQTGLYAFGRQAEAGAWNLAQLGGALSLLAPVEALNEALRLFSPAYEEAMSDAFFRRLGLRRAGEGDFAFVTNFLRWMTETGAPYERVFFDWFCGSASEDRASQSPAAELYAQDKFSEIRDALSSAAPDRPERLARDYFKGAKPCTMLIDEVEAIWAPIADEDDWSAFRAKLEEIGRLREALGFDASRFIP